MVSEQAAAQGGPGLVQRLTGAAVGVLLPVLLVPLLIGLLLGGRPGGLGAVLGSLVAFLIALTAGWRTAASAMPGAVVVTAMASVVQGSPVWVVLLTLIGGLAGLASHWGLMGPVALTGMLVSIVPGSDGWQDAAILTLFLVLGAVNGVLAARRMGLPPHQAPTELPAGRAAAVGVALAAVAGAAGWIAVSWDSPHAYWLPMTVFVLATPTAGVMASHKTVSRLAGTLVAILVVALTVPLQLSRPAVLLIALLLLLLSLVYAEPLWVNAALSTGAVVLLLTATGADPGVAAADRLEAVVIGSVLLLCGIAVIALTDRQRTGQRAAAIVEDYDPAGLRDA